MSDHAQSTCRMVHRTIMSDLRTVSFRMQSESGSTILVGKELVR